MHPCLRSCWLVLGVWASLAVAANQLVLWQRQFTTLHQYLSHSRAMENATSRSVCVSRTKERANLESKNFDVVQLLHNGERTSSYRSSLLQLMDDLALWRAQAVHTAHCANQYPFAFVALSHHSEFDVCFTNKGPR